MSETAKVSQEQIDNFRTLLDTLSVECKRLVESNRGLKAENIRLKKEKAKLMDQLAVKSASPSLTQKERIVLKQHLKTLIKRIDHHLEDPA